MLTSDQANTIAKKVVDDVDATAIITTDPTFETFTALLHALDFVVPGAGTTSSQVVEAITGRSLTVPSPAGPLVILGHEASDPVSLVITATQQAVHATQMRRAGQVQSWADYLASGELRALRLGHSLAAGAFAAYLLTGEAPDFDALVRAARTMAAPLTISTTDETTLRTVLASQLSDLADGERPSLAAAGAVLARLREVAPDAIAAEGWRA